MSPLNGLAPAERRHALIDQARRAVLLGQAESPAHALDPVIERSWRRCLAMGLQPQHRVEFEAVAAADVGRALEVNRPLLQAAGPVIRSLTRAMLHTRYFSILTDAKGIVIDVNGPVDRENPRAAALARVGVNLAESAVGTTAIGSCLTDQQPIWLHRGEHFFLDTGIFSCAGAPIWGPDGKCVGMLDLTGVNVTEQPALKHLVTQSARSIENALTLAQPHRLLLRLNWPGRVLGDDNDGLVCLDDDGHITALNRPAREMLCLPGQGGHCSQVFGVEQGMLFDAARQQRSAFEVPLWSGLRLQVLVQMHGEPAGTGARRAPAGHGVPLKDVEVALIRKAVDDARGNVMEAARVLGISRATVYRKLASLRRSTG